MALQSVLQDEPAKAAVISALRIAQLGWHLNQAWGKVDGSTCAESIPSLNEDEVEEIAKRADRLFQRIIAGERTAPKSAEGLPTAKNVSHFTKRKKRGAKVKTGPCAAILTFPAPSVTDRPTGETLLSEWAWLERNHTGWNDENLSGCSEKNDWQKLFLEKAARASIEGHPMPDGAAIRKEIAKYRAIIEKRVRVKDWLEIRGVNWEEVKTPEQALFFIFDFLHVSEQPTSA